MRFESRWATARHVVGRDPRTRQPAAGVISRIAGRIRRNPLGCSRTAIEAPGERHRWPRMRRDRDERIVEHCAGRYRQGVHRPVRCRRGDDAAGLGDRGTRGPCGLHGNDVGWTRGGRPWGPVGPPSTVNAIEPERPPGFLTMTVVGPAGTPVGTMNVDLLPVRGNYRRPDAPDRDPNVVRAEAVTGDRDTVADRRGSRCDCIDETCARLDDAGASRPQATAPIPHSSRTALSSPCGHECRESDGVLASLVRVRASRLCGDIARCERWKL